MREIYPALSLGDHLSVDVSEYGDLHPDIFAIPGRGAFINANPGASILGAIPYALARPVIGPIVAGVRHARAETGSPLREYSTIYPLAHEFYRRAQARGLDVKLGLAAGAMQTLLMAPLSALSAVVMFRVLASRVPSVRTALGLALLYAFATPVFYRTGQLNHNLLVAHCAFFAFAALWRPWEDPIHPRRPRYLLAGLLAGWAVVLDYSGLLVVGLVGAYALLRGRALPGTAPRRGDLSWLVLGMALGVAPLLAYQWHAFGNPLYPPQYYMPPTAITRRFGYLALDWPHLDLLWDTAFGLRFGLFTSAPLLLLALWVPGWRDARARITGRLETWSVLLFSLAFFLYSGLNQYTRLQFNSGVRHIVPAVPFLFLLAAGTLRRMPAPAAIVTGIVWTYWSWCLAMYRDVEQGLGVLEPVIRITLHGPQLPWVTTLEQMGYLPKGSSVLPLCALGAIVGALWTVGSPLRRGRELGARGGGL